MNSKTEEIFETILTSQEANNQADSRLESIPYLDDQPYSNPDLMHLSGMVLIFIGVAFVLCTLLLWYRKSDPVDILRVFGILSIVGLSVLMLMAGFSNEQLTPIIGLFGAIAGYLLGKESNLSRQNNDDTQ